MRGKTLAAPGAAPEQAQTPSIGDRTLAALAWRFTAKFAALILRLAVMVVLARMVSVEAFGLLNEATIVIGLAGLASQIGMGPALVQRWQLSQTHIRVVFTVSTLSGMLLTALLWWGAPLAGAACHTDEVIPILRLLSWTFLFTGLGTTAGALLERKLAYRSLFVVELVSYSVGYGLVGVTLACLGYGVWALAWAPVVDALVRAALHYAFAPHSVWPSLARVEMRELFHFGVGITFVRLANYSALTGDNFVVGRQLGPAPLGLYGRAYHLMVLPMSEFSEVISCVLFPAYAKFQNDPERLRRASLASVFVTALVVFPTLTGLAIAAPELITGVFGAQWHGAILPLQILCVGGFFRSIHNLGDSVARARGAVYAMAWRHSVYALCVILAALVGSRWGISGVATGVVGALVVIYLLIAQLNIRLINTTWRVFLLSHRSGLVLAAAVAGVAYPLTLLLRAAHLPDLAVLSGTGVFSLVAALAVGWCLPRRWHDPVAAEAISRTWQRLPVPARSWLLCLQRATTPVAGA